MFTPYYLSHCFNCLLCNCSYLCKGHKFIPIKHNVKLKKKHKTNKKKDHCVYKDCLLSGHIWSLLILPKPGLLYLFVDSYQQNYLIILWYYAFSTAHFYSACDVFYMLPYIYSFVPASPYYLFNKIISEASRVD